MPTARFDGAQRTRMDWEADGPTGLQVWEFAYDKYPIHVQAPHLRLKAAEALQAARRTVARLHSVVCRICSCTRLSLLRSATRSRRASALGCPQRAPLRTCAGSVCGSLSERSVRLRDDGLFGPQPGFSLLCSGAYSGSTVEPKSAITSLRSTGHFATRRDQ